MPFKTKQQKIAAAQRRFIYTQGAISLPDLTNVKIDASRDKAAGDKNKAFDLAYVKFDLVKISMAASFLIGAQIVLSVII
ncbi:hypothetical protein HYU92_06160 [Candidatus Curtissbacteria bacterium]|nr:hypothetical protein [Candidatus Curtissbacteria bacterium]